MISDQNILLVEDDPDMILLQKALLGERDDSTPGWIYAFFLVGLWIVIILAFFWR